MCREYSCCCGHHHHEGLHGHHHRRRFLTKQEKIEKLQNYADELKKELTAVQERIRELKD